LGKGADAIYGSCRGLVISVALSSKAIFLSFLEVSANGRFLRRAERHLETSSVCVASADRVEGAQFVTQRDGATRDEAHNRDHIVGRVVDEAVLGERRHDDGRNACTRAPAITLQQGDVIPDATILVTGDDDQNEVPLATVLQMVDYFIEVLAIRNDICIVRMFVDVALKIVNVHH
jgi:hypothetical protein